MAQSARKNRKLRGSRTHGYGNAQKHRGAGSRGGRGMAGSKKQNWMWVSKNMPGKFGRSGFKRHASIIKNSSTLNVGDLDDRAEKWLSAEKAKKTKDVITVDLGKIGIDKLLGSGKVTNKYALTVDSCSQKALAKIEACGGKLTVKEKPVKEKLTVKEKSVKEGAKPAGDEGGEPVEEAIDEPGVSETDGKVSA